MLRADDLARVTWCCLHYATAADVTSQLRTALQSAGIAAFDLNGEPLRTRDDLLRGIADAMQFPDYFGMNWDAVIDCLRLEPAPRVVIRGGPYYRTWYYDERYYRDDNGRVHHRYRHRRYHDDD